MIENMFEIRLQVFKFLKVEEKNQREDQGNFFDKFVQKFNHN
jgi:hypothetical protein